MKRHKFGHWPLSAAISSVVVLGGLAGPSMAGPVISVDGSPFLGPDAKVVINDAANHVEGKQRYIVRFTELPLALYDGSVSGLARPARMTAAKTGRSKLDSKSPSAQAYLSYLGSQQSDHLASMASVLGRSLVPSRSMRHALNAVVVDLSPDEARKVVTLPQVAGVYADRLNQLATDLGPGFIGAASLWWGASAGQDSMFATGFEDTRQFRGEGMVIGDIDTGYNSASPSFAATDDAGYTFQNPLGAGNYLGHCGVAGISTAGCNDKVIGVYDNINPSPTSVEDQNGHGSHTGSTAGGNGRSATLGGFAARISGVAPHANMVIFYACGSSGCPTSATSASVDQAVADGVVDVLNYSISGGDQPWDDPTSLAFLSAADAGIFIAAAAGNTSASVPNQVPGTVNHYEPWTISVAAGTHTGGPIGFQLTVNDAGAPGPVPLKPAASGAALAAAVASAPIKVSPNFDDAAGNDGCSAYPAGTFTGYIALIKYGGTCGTNARAGAAKNAGATHVVIVANTDGDFTSGANQTIPVWTTGLTIGTQLKTFIAANPADTVNVSYPAARLPAQPDKLASFSLLGPTNVNLIKPDIQAPGVNILAAVNAGSPANPNAVGLLDGTSMATPHTTGSGAMLMGLHPGWTPMEVKSALMLTAKEAALVKADGTTPSDPYDRGSGRIQIDVASRTALVMNETGLNFANANPATGGDPTTLNVPSMENRKCITVTGPGASANTCSFLRKLHSAVGHTVNWTTSITGVTGTVTPSAFPVVANGTRNITVSVDASAYASDGQSHFGELVLTPDDGSPTLHMPIAVAVPAPAISVPGAISVSIPNGSTTASANLAVSNVGGPTLDVTNTNVTDAAVNYVHVAIDQPSQGNNGYYNTYFTNFGTGSYASDDFSIVDAGTNLTKISAPGFLTGAGTALGSGRVLHFRLYADAAGVPAGAPEATDTHNAPAVWSYDATLPHAGITTTGGTITLDLAAAGAPNTNLATGTYWLEVYPGASYSANGGWAQYVSTTGNATRAQEFGPVFGETDWASITDAPGMAMRLEYKVACGAAWLSTGAPTMSIGGLLSSDLAVSADSTLFGGGSQATGYLCLQSNDAANPLVTVRVSAVQN